MRCDGHGDMVESKHAAVDVIVYLILLYIRDAPFLSANVWATCWLFEFTFIRRLFIFSDNVVCQYDLYVVRFDRTLR